MSASGVVEGYQWYSKGTGYLKYQSNRYVKSEGKDKGAGEDQRGVGEVEWRKEMDRNTWLLSSISF